MKGQGTPVCTIRNQFHMWEISLRRSIRSVGVLKMSDSDYPRGVVESMLKRMMEVLEREGAMTHY